MRRQKSGTRLKMSGRNILEAKMCDIHSSVANHHNYFYNFFAFILYSSFFSRNLVFCLRIVLPYALYISEFAAILAPQYYHQFVVFALIFISLNEEKNTYVKLTKTKSTFLLTHGIYLLFV